MADSKLAGPLGVNLDAGSDRVNVRTSQLSITFSQHRIGFAPGFSRMLIAHLHRPPREAVTAAVVIVRRADGGPPLGQVTAIVDIQLLLSPGTLPFRGLSSY